MAAKATAATLLLAESPTPPTAKAAHRRRVARAARVGASATERREASTRAGKELEVVEAEATMVEAEPMVNLSFFVVAQHSLEVIVVSLFCVGYYASGGGGSGFVSSLSPVDQNTVVFQRGGTGSGVAHNAKHPEAPSGVGNGGPGVRDFSLDSFCLLCSCCSV